MRMRWRRFGSKLSDFFKKYGFDAVLALILFNFPMYAMIFIRGEEFRAFALWWTALWWGLGPLTPGWLFTIILAVFLRWARLSIWKGILWLKEAMLKLQLQNQLSAYLTAEEITMILEMARRVSHDSNIELSKAKEIIRINRLQMIDDQWSKVKVELDPPEEQNILDTENQDN